MSSLTGGGGHVTEFELPSCGRRLHAGCGNIFPGIMNDDGGSAASGIGLEGDLQIAFRNKEIALGFRMEAKFRRAGQLDHERFSLAFNGDSEACGRSILTGIRIKEPGVEGDFSVGSGVGGLDQRLLRTQQVHDNILDRDYGVGKGDDTDAGFGIPGNVAGVPESASAVSHDLIVALANDPPAEGLLGLDQGRGTAGFQH